MHTHCSKPAFEQRHVRRKGTAEKARTELPATQNPPAEVPCLTRHASVCRWCDEKEKGERDGLAESSASADKEAKISIRIGRKLIKNRPKNVRPGVGKQGGRREGERPFTDKKTG